MRCAARGSLLAFLALLAPAAGRGQGEIELLAKTRVFPEVGAGFRAIARGAAGHYYVLTAPAPAVAVYDATGKRVGQVPAISAAATKGAELVFGEDLDADASGRVAVADRGANQVKVYAPDGTLALAIPVASPTSVALLSGGEVAVASMNADRLVTVYDAKGHVARDFGDPSDLAERKELNRFLNMGRLATDPAGNLYYAFDYLPEPTVRKYDRYGYAAFEIQLSTLEFEPAAQAARREIFRKDQGAKANIHKIVTGVGVDPESQEIWVSLGTLLLHFDREGNRVAEYRTYTPEGARLEATAILVEPNRLLLGADPLGIYEFSRPDKAKP